jgi:hypothetical protein
MPIIKTAPRRPVGGEEKEQREGQFKDADEKDRRFGPAKGGHGLLGDGHSHQLGRGRSGEHEEREKAGQSPAEAREGGV